MNRIIKTAIFAVLFTAANSGMVYWLDIGWWQREAVIGAGAEQAGEAFERVDAAHPIVVRTPQRGQVARIPHAGRRRAEHIGIERKHDTRVTERVASIDGMAERELTAAQLVIAM